MVQTAVNDLPGLLKVHGDSTRLRILALLHRQELTAGELARALGMAPSRVSNHLRILRDHDLLRERREGTTVHLRAAGSSAPEVAQGLWRALSGEVEQHPEHEADCARLAGVLAARSHGDDFFDALAGEWDKVGAQFANGQARQRVVAGLLPPNLVLADLGCGTGYMARALMGIAGHLICVDRSEAMLEQARHNLSAAPPGLRVETRLGELDRLPLEDGLLDGAVMGMVLHHLEDPLPALRETLRVLKPGGTFALLELEPHREEWAHDLLGDRHLGLSPTAVLDALSAAGFTDLHTEPVDDRYCPLPPDRHAPEDRVALPLYLVRARRPLT